MQDHGHLWPKTRIRIQRRGPGKLTEEIMLRKTSSIEVSCLRRWFTPSLAALFTVAVLVSASQSATSPGYKVTNTYKIGGEGGWDYLIADAAARRLYISRATHVIVLDLDSGKPHS